MIQWVQIYASYTYFRDVLPQVNLERNPFDYIFQHAQGPVMALFLIHLFTGSLLPTKRSRTYP